MSDAHILSSCFFGLDMQEEILPDVALANVPRTLFLSTFILNWYTYTNTLTVENMGCAKKELH
jgi:hypothetical protein